MRPPALHTPRPPTYGGQAWAHGVRGRMGPPTPAAHAAACSRPSTCLQARPSTHSAVHSSTHSMGPHTPRQSLRQRHPITQQRHPITQQRHPITQQRHPLSCGSVISSGGVPFPHERDTSYPIPARAAPPATAPTQPRRPRLRARQPAHGATRLGERDRAAGQSFDQRLLTSLVIEEASAQSPRRHRGGRNSAAAAATRPRQSHRECA